MSRAGDRQDHGPFICHLHNVDTVDVDACDPHASDDSKEMTITMNEYENNDMTNPATTILLVDPTSADGESALDLLTDADRDVALVVLLTGAASAALREFSRGADIDLATAGWTYLEQVADRIATPSRTVEVIAVQGPDTGFELITLMRGRATARVLLPSSVERLERRLLDQLEFAGDLVEVARQTVGAANR
jgi:hypothetical protein